MRELRTAQESDNATRRLAELHRRATRYEIAAEVGGKAYLLGYRLNAGRGELVEMARAAGGELLANLAGLTDFDPVTYTRAAGWNFGNGKLRVRRTGRTERECLISGELPAFSAAQISEAEHG